MTGKEWEGKKGEWKRREARVGKREKGKARGISHIDDLTVLCTLFHVLELLVLNELEKRLLIDLVFLNKPKLYIYCRMTKEL